MTLSEMSKEQRQKHIDLQTPCQTDKNYKGACRKALINFTGINPGRSWNTCHLCENDSQSDKPCRNPLHLYWGTCSENSLDVDPKTGLTPAKKTAAAKLGMTHSDEYKAKMREVMKAWHAKRKAAAQKFKKRGLYSEEHKAKLSTAAKEDWIRRKAAKLSSVTCVGESDDADRSGVS